MINSYTLAALLTCVAGKDEPRAWLRDVLYCTETHCLVTADGHRMIWLQLPDSVPHMPGSFTIPARAVRECIKAIGKRRRNMDAPQMLTRGTLGPVTFEPGEGWPPHHSWRRVVPAGGALPIRGTPGNLQPRYMADLYAVGSVTWYTAEENEPVPFRMLAGPLGDIMHGVVMPVRLPPAAVGHVWPGAPG